MSLIKGSEIRRQIFETTNMDAIRKRVHNNAEGITEDAILEMGEALEQVVHLKGWAIIESKMLQALDINGVYMSGNADPVKIGKGQGMIELMQFIHGTIKMKNEILAKHNEGRNG